MSITFTKLFSSITESTIWCEPANTRIVWITMLAMADRNGRVWASIPGLANRARVPLEDTEQALKTLMSPDRYSRTTDNEGRRIEPIDGGWRLLNHAKYRDIRDDEIRREQNREAQATHRSKKSAEALTVSNSKQASANSSAQAEADTEADSNKSKSTPLAASASRSTAVAIDFDFVAGQFSGVTEVDHERWGNGYPAIDVPREIAAAAAWLMANPKNRKSNYQRFLVNWFSRSQDKAPRAVAPVAEKPIPVCQYRDKPGADICGLKPAIPSENYGDKPLCEHHHNKLKPMKVTRERIDEHLAKMKDVARTGA